MLIALPKRRVRGLGGFCAFLIPRPGLRLVVRNLTPAPRADFVIMPECERRDRTRPPAFS